MPHDIFISYGNQDKPTADAIRDAMERRRFRCWIAPRDIQPGQNWASAIVEAIAGSKVMVLVVSEALNQSSNVPREVERAATLGLVIVPFRVGDIKLNGAIEYFVQSCHWLDALTPPLEARIDELSDVVSRLLTPRDEPRRGGPVRVTVHFAEFTRSWTRCCFINVTNLCQDHDVEVTHVWVDTAPQTFASPPDRPLPRRLRPFESWETWIPNDQLPPDLPEEMIFNLGRARLSTGEVVASVRNDTVPPRGTVPGGPISAPPRDTQ